MNIWQLISLTAIVAFTLAAALCDLRTKRLPNVLTVPAFLGGVVFHALRGAAEGGWVGLGEGLLVALAGFATGFGILLVMWLIGGSGAGDVKFMGALGAWLGAALTLQVFVVSAAIVLVITICVFGYEIMCSGWQRTNRQCLAPAGSTANGDVGLQDDPQASPATGRQRLMPYGVPVALSTWIVLAVSWLAQVG